MDPGIEAIFEEVEHFKERSESLKKLIEAKELSIKRNNKKGRRFEEVKGYDGDGLAISILIRKLSQNPLITDRDLFQLNQAIHANLLKRGAVYKHNWIAGDLLAISRHVFHYRLAGTISDISRHENELFTPSHLEY